MRMALHSWRAENITSFGMGRGTLEPNGPSPSPGSSAITRPGGRDGCEGEGQSQRGAGRPAATAATTMAATAADTTAKATTTGTTNAAPPTQCAQTFPSGMCLDDRVNTCTIAFRSGCGARVRRRAACTYFYVAVMVLTSCADRSFGYFVLWLFLKFGTPPLRTGMSGTFRYHGSLAAGN